jgi:F-type H+-transporting ATPase subunit gamma
MKITRAMELIAASRISKAQARIAAIEPYTHKMNEVVRNVASASEAKRHPLLQEREMKTAGVVIVTSDRGLAGAYNSNVLRLAEKQAQVYRTEDDGVRIYAVGKKALQYFRYRKYDIGEAYIGVTDMPQYEDAKRIADRLMSDYLIGEIDRVEVFATDFHSVLTQVPAWHPLLPVLPPETKEEEAAIGYTFEPSPAEILDSLLPRYVESVLFGLLVGSSAAEHASRMRAMKNATENADELVGTLSRKANQARQAEITSEISEIVGGAVALAEAEQGANK